MAVKTRNKIVGSFLKKLQNLREVLSDSSMGRILHEVKLGGLLVDFYSNWVIKRGFHRVVLLGQNINFRISSKSEVTGIDMAERLEGQLLRHFIKVLQNKDIFYDIGANIGITCLPIAIAGEAQQPTIFAFEPHPETAQRLKENIALNDVSIEVYQLAMGERCGQTKLNVSNFGEGTHTIVNSALKNNASIEVPIIAVDSFVQQGHRAPNLIKIDVEGYEMNVLLGMEKTLKSNSVRNLFIEIHPNLLEKAGYSEEKLVKWLEDHGYKVTWKMIRGGEIHYQFSQRLQ